MSARHVQPSRRPKRTRRGNVWVVACSCLLAAFTVFVLLDAFAIQRVEQTVQEADLSSIVQAEGADAVEDADNAGASDEADGEAGDSPAGADGTATAKQPRSDGESAGGHRHGKHGGPSGKPGSSEANSGKAGSANSGGSGRSAASANAGTLEEGAGSASTAGTVIGNYSDDNLSIQVSSVRAYDTDIYVADIQASSAEYLKTALAQNAYGRNLKDTTSNMADAAGAILAINGDYYGFRDTGYVLRNGVLYRDTAATGTDALVVYGDGSLASVSQDQTSAQQLAESGAWQVLSFGPTLVQDGALAVTADSEVSQSMGSNPRTAIGMVSPLHYLVVVSDGRTGDNDGLSLYQLAQVMLDNGATYAYNLDGGGSTTLYFQGEVLNNPTSGNRNGEREVSDIVYFG